MTPTEMEDAIKNLQDQANRIEQFLPNLVVREELLAVRDELKRHAVILNEATRDEIKLVAENLSAQIAHVNATLSAQIADVNGTLGAEIANVNATLSAQISQLANQVSALSKPRSKQK